MHGNEPARAKAFKHFNGFIWSHVHVAKGFRVVSANRKKRNLRSTVFTNVTKPLKIRTVASVINCTALVFKNESAVAPMVIAQITSTPVFGRSQSYLPIQMAETFPPFKFYNAAKAEIMSQVSHTPWHHRDVGIRQFAKRGFVEMIVVSMGKQNEINPG